ncbi:MAG TPA: multicopper oxidase family protein [Anaeromyxobacteraceae bacterium]|nr:multicopper oxidase family protein [Anaeromyxobacteraceae bacterium]
MTRTRFGRRQFVLRSTFAAAGAAFAPRALGQMMGGGGGGGMGGGGGGGIIDPPVGSPLQEPPVAVNHSTTPGVVDVSIDASVAPAIVGGTAASLLTYNGSFIAPTIRANPRDVIYLRFRNSLPPTTQTNLLGHVKNVTNVHVHGFHVSPGADMMTGLPADNVHLQIAAGGGEQVYCYDLMQQRPGSMGLYHPHVHGTVAEQFWGGLVGALDVGDGPITALAAYPRKLLVLKDLTIANGAPEPYTMTSEYMHGKEGAVVMVNAQVNPYLEVRPGEVHRLRIVNASNARFYRLAIQGHALNLVGTDGGLLDAPYALSEILLAPSERIDVLVKASNTTGDYKVLALPYARQGSMTSAQVTLMTLRVKGSRTNAALPKAVYPGAVRLADDPMLPRASFALSMMMGRGYINGKSFDVLADGSISADEHHSTVDTDEIWEVVNQSGMDHPWHQHVNDAQVLSIAGGDANFAKYAQLYTRIPAWKDTIIVPKWGSATFRVPIRHFSGMTMYHCHILEHEDIGMMGMWHIMDGGMPM